MLEDDATVDRPARNNTSEGRADLELGSIHDERCAADSDDVASATSSSGSSERRLTQTELRAELAKERNDSRNIAFLLFLYFLQGIPLGIIGAASFILADKKSSYSDIALFSIAGWPFSLKLLWAPFVDSVYFSKLGRRKSWLAPLQYSVGLTMFALSFSVDGWLQAPTITHDHVVLLTLSFLFVYFLVATQDIVVDGWAVSLLSRRRMSWASTANVIGQAAGSCVSNLSLLSLNSASFCNKWLRSAEHQSAEGLLSFGDFLFFWSFVFFVATTLVLLKRERGDDMQLGSEEYFTIRETYWTLLQLIKLPPVLRYILLLFVVKIAFAAVDNVAYVKIIEAGFPKETLAFFDVLLLPITLFFPLLISRWRSYTEQPLRTWSQLVYARLFSGASTAVLLYFAPNFRVAPSASSSNFDFLSNFSYNANFSSADSEKESLSFTFTVLLFLIYLVCSCVMITMFLASMAFHARVSHPQIGGTHMTLLNTLANLSSTLPGFISLWILDYVTISACELPLDRYGGESAMNVSIVEGGRTETVSVMQDFKCHTASGKQLCEAARGSCITRLDGFYIEVLCSLLYGLAVSWWCLKLAKRLNSLPLISWIPDRLRSADSRVDLVDAEEESAKDV